MSINSYQHYKFSYLLKKIKERKNYIIVKLLRLYTKYLYFEG